MLAIAAMLLIPALGWACSCGDSLPLCQVLAKPGATLDGGPDSKIFVGRVISSSPASEKEAWDLAAKYGERHPDAKYEPSSSFLSLEGHKQFLLELWGDTLSAESRARVLAASFGGAVAFTRLEVIEAFTGTKTGDVIDMFGGLGGADCSFHFAPGSTYLVMASRQDGYWTTSICSRSQEITGKSSSDVDALRSWRDKKPLRTSIYGAAVDLTDRGERQGPRILPGMPVRLSGPGSPLDTVTDSRGEFRFDNLGPGTYRLVTLKPGWSIEVRVGEERSSQFTAGCHEVLAMAREQLSSVRGVVQPSPGQTLVRAEINLEGATAQYESRRMPHARFDADGNFLIEQVAPGYYRLAIDPLNTPKSASAEDPGNHYPGSFYPGVPTRDRAEVIHVEHGADLVLPAQWTLPAPFAEKKIEAQFVRADGKPAAGVRFRVRDRESGHLAVSNANAGPDGRAGFTVLAERRYRIETLARDPSHGLSYVAAVEFGPEFTGTLAIQLAEDGDAPR